MVGLEECLACVMHREEVLFGRVCMHWPESLVKLERIYSKQDLPKWVTLHPARELKRSKRVIVSLGTIWDFYLRKESRFRGLRGLSIFFSKKGVIDWIIWGTSGLERE